MSYVTNFYKAKEHNYEDFFSNFEEGEESIKVKAELNSLLKLVEEKTSAYTVILNKRYNVHYTPIDKKVVLTYHNRDDIMFYLNKLYEEVKLLKKDTDVSKKEFALDKALSSADVYSAFVSYRVKNK